MAAADEYLMRLSYGQEEGISPLLDDEQKEELLIQWREYRTDMEATTSAPLLSFSEFHSERTSDARFRVRVDVQATWRSTDTAGRVSGFSSDARPWLFEVGENEGWRVIRVDAPEWCGGYVRSDACSS
ncbi:hypothetical protein [Actinoplanes rectilineatus]|uniref:hypothetical protein n=1 Tax=Actinoplanes rectilineatus TaxID=113571 RepID=UPI001FE236DD|nr:hypothetical protein [Actinoplanes rectilineatus]